MDGVISINKPSGITSHDVVAIARRLLREKRIGHTGTLDPLATGVLVLCIGKATRIAQYIQEGDKEYHAIMRLGITTDTLDAKGVVQERKEYSPPPREEIIKVIQGFIGTITQTPPAYSAVKIDGIPSYKRARKGISSPNKPRMIKIHSIELTSYDNPYVHLSIRCSKGTYIRSLCSDIGAHLGMGAHLTGLERTRSGSFRIEDALTLDTFQNLAEAGKAESVLLSIDQALFEIPAVTVEAPDVERVMHGNSISYSSEKHIDDDVLLRLHDTSGKFMALARLTHGVIKMELVFLAA